MSEDLGQDLYQAIERLADTAFTDPDYMDHIREITVTREAFFALATRRSLKVESVGDGTHWAELFDITIKCEPEVTFTNG